MGWSWSFCNKGMGMGMGMDGEWGWMGNGDGSRSWMMDVWMFWVERQTKKKLSLPQQFFVDATKRSKKLKRSKRQLPNLPMYIQQDQ
jgi:hypothetical protein